MAFLTLHDNFNTYKNQSQGIFSTQYKRVLTSEACDYQTRRFEL